MPARGLPTDVESVRVAAETGSILVYPGDGTANLIGENHQAAADILHPSEVGHDIMHPSGEEYFGRTCEILRTPAAPGAAMNKDEDRC